ncbi:unnamed protein product [Brachionus calyciflorus]|uniref:Uncharacterized protein n=1 Tax=Brachionus calyciflorus TaxID=104777 RepID=A0A814BPQ6_9BILA|nr:unnamed protein product [Brachionus calyciflorus]
MNILILLFCLSLFVDSCEFAPTNDFNQIKQPQAFKVSSNDRYFSVNSAISLTTRFNFYIRRTIDPKRTTFNPYTTSTFLTPIITLPTYGSPSPISTFTPLPPPGPQPPPGPSPYPPAPPGPSPHPPPPPGPSPNPQFGPTFRF